MLALWFLLIAHFYVSGMWQRLVVKNGRKRHVYDESGLCSRGSVYPTGRACDYFENKLTCDFLTHHFCILSTMSKQWSVRFASTTN